MINVLITGANSSIGNAIEQQLNNNSKLFRVDVIDTLNDEWKNAKFNKYQVVINVAGIVHRNHKQTDPSLYFSINRDMAIEIARTSKDAGVKHFIQMSTMSVYGIETGRISNETKANPVNNYAASKLEADEKLIEMNSKEFIVSIIRPPMVYGYNAPGNYNKISKVIKKFRFFPKVDNKRSFIFTENLARFIEKVIQNGIDGIQHPQNDLVVSTLQMAEAISKAHNQKLRVIPNIFGVFNILKKLPVFRKIFGTLYYDESLKTIKYEQVDFEKSIMITESE